MLSFSFRGFRVVIKDSYFEGSGEAEQTYRYCDADVMVGRRIYIYNRILHFGAVFAQAIVAFFSTIP